MSDFSSFNGYNVKDKKAREMIEATKKNYCNVLKGTASGEAIGINDVSPIEHEMSVKVSGVDDLTSVKVRKFGKNLFEFKDPAMQNGTIIETLENGAVVSGNVSANPGYNGYQNGWFNCNKNSKNLYFKKGDIVYISADITWLNIDNYNGNSPFGFYLYRIGVGKSNNATTSIPYKPTEEAINVTYRFIAKLTILEDDYYYPVFTLDSCTMKIENIQISFSKNDTYESYIEPIEYTPDADGVVSGVTSLYPSTTLMTDTDGAVIDATYNRDINKAFEKIKNAILSLGGNV